MTENTLLTTIDARGVASLVLNRPEVHNAFDDSLIAQLTKAIEELDANGAVRIIRFSTTGPNFSAGADLNWMRRMASYSRAENIEDAIRLGRLMQTLAGTRKPTIGLIQGSAYGGGVGLVACFDLAIATRDAQFCLSEVRLGLIPSVISPYVIAAIGPRAARRYCLTAERFDAAEAHRLGLVHEVVETDGLQEAADRITNALLKNGPEAVAEAKATVQAVAWSPIGEAIIRNTAEWIADRRASEEGKEGVSAFLEKRNPAWIQD